MLELSTVFHFKKDRETKLFVFTANPASNIDNGTLNYFNAYAVISKLEGVFYDFFGETQLRYLSLGPYMND